MPPPLKDYDVPRETQNAGEVIRRSGEKKGFFYGMMHVMYEQRRRHKRIPIAAATTLRFRDKEHIPPIETMVGSISISGIGLYTDKPVEKESHILLEIKFISFDGSMYHESTSGRIVYVNNIAGINYIGIEFDEMINPAEQPHLYKHLFTVMKSAVNEP